ncbi:hypothetical protein ACWEOV_36255 [Streptomyces sp. NPDC004365]
MRRAAGVSGSQLSHYFANKESLVRAVIDWQAENMLGFHRSERSPASTRSRRTRSGRPSSSSPAARSRTAAASDPSRASRQDRSGCLRRPNPDLTRVFAEWRDIFRAGLERMQYDGRLDASADPARPAHMLIAAYRRGSLLGRSPAT